MFSFMSYLFGFAIPVNNLDLLTTFIFAAIVITNIFNEAQIHARKMCHLKYLRYASVNCFIVLGSLFLVSQSLASMDGKTSPTVSSSTVKNVKTMLLRDPHRTSSQSKVGGSDYRQSHSRDFKKDEDVLDVLKEDSYFWERELKSLSLSYSSTATYASKTSWPECVEAPLTCLECQVHINAEGNPELKNVIIIPYDAIVTLDYRIDRVRIFCNDTVVTQIPIVG
jgi:hypothetical protein